MQISTGDKPDGFVLHGCDNPPCVRVGDGHLYVGSQQDNVNDRESHGRSASHRGELNGRAKLSLPDAELIRTRYAAGGVTQTVLAIEYGVTQALISKIVSRRIWDY